MSGTGHDGAGRAAETVARLAYGRLVAVLAGRARDLAAAEDALAEAFAQALATWPAQGVPDNPEGWLMRVASRRLSNAWRGAAVAAAWAADVLHRAEEGAASGGDWPEERLALMCLCAHPAIAAEMRAPLMLQAVLGLDAGRIGAAFLVPAATMGQRLVRAKAKIREAGLRFDPPGPEAMGERLGDVLDAVYAAFGTGWEEAGEGQEAGQGLAEEAIWLGRVIVGLVPGASEAKGLLALMLYAQARVGARRDAGGAFVPLDRQDPRRWSRERIIEAEGLLAAAARGAQAGSGTFGRYACEAAIQSVHCQRGVMGRTNHAALVMLYDLLYAHVPATGVAVARAGALLGAGRVGDALAALEAVAGEGAAYQPWWATRAAALAAAGRADEAAAARARAVALTADRRVADWLRAQG